MEGSSATFDLGPWGPDCTCVVDGVCPQQMCDVMSPGHPLLLVLCLQREAVSGPSSLSDPDFKLHSLLTHALSQTHLARLWRGVRMLTSWYGQARASQEQMMTLQEKEVWQTFAACVCEASAPWCCVCSYRWCVPGWGSSVWWRPRHAGRGKRSSRPPASFELPRTPSARPAAPARHALPRGSEITRKHTRTGLFWPEGIDLQQIPSMFLCSASGPRWSGEILKGEWKQVARSHAVWSILPRSCSMGAPSTRALNTYFPACLLFGSTIEILSSFTFQLQRLKSLILTSIQERTKQYDYNTTRSMVTYWTPSSRGSFLSVLISNWPADSRPLWESDLIVHVNCRVAVWCLQRRPEGDRGWG